MIKKRVKIFLSMALIASMLCSNVAFAKNKVETVSYSGTSVKCTLNCVWSDSGNDSATAKTNWTGKQGYQVKVMLYVRNTRSEGFKFVDKDYGRNGAVATCSKAGVYEYESVHAVHNNANNSEKKLCTIIDW